MIISCKELKLPIVTESAGRFGTVPGELIKRNLWKYVIPTNRLVGNFWGNI